jgi:hypothetical protein
MSLRYCSLHGRVFSVPQQCWLPFPENKIQEVNAYAALLRATNTEACFLTVIETGCDACTATFRHIAQIGGATDGLRPGEG